jgi:phosphate transport system permease protein
VFGFSDGSVRFGALEFATEILSPENLPQGLTRINDQDSTDGSTVFTKIPGNQFRKVSFSLTLDKEFIPVSESGKPLVALAYHVSGQAERQARAFVALDEEGVPSLNLVTSRINLLTGERRAQVTRTQLPPLPQGVKPHAISLTEKADQVVVAEKTGTVFRYNTADLNAPMLAETVRVVPDSSTLTSFGYLLGGQSLVVGGSDGSLNIRCKGQSLRVPRDQPETAGPAPFGRKDPGVPDHSPVPPHGRPSGPSGGWPGAFLGVLGPSS